MSASVALLECLKFLQEFQTEVEKGLLSTRNQYNIVISRSYSVSQTERKWDLYSGLCLERKPVIVKPLNELEQKISRMFFEMESEQSCKSDHEIKREEDLERAEKIKSNSKLVDLDVVLQQTAHEFEEMSSKEFDAFQSAPLLTSADRNNDVRSLNRKLSSHLLLVVNEKINGEDCWVLPFGVREGSETLRETAERVLSEKLGDKLNVLFLGNAPCGFYKYPYPKGLNFESYGAKVFYFKAFYVSGQVELRGNVSDYQWATREELPKLFLKDQYFKKISQFLIDDCEDVSRGELSA